MGQGEMSYINEQYKIKKLMGILSEQDKMYEKVFSIVSSYASKHGNQRIHVTDNENLSFNGATDQFTREKPNGLWYAFGDSWVYFMKISFRESWYDNVKHAYVFEINKDKIIRLISKDDIISFTAKYGDNAGNINWDLVKEDYSGIEIPTYTKFKFRDMFEEDDIYRWLYPWDVPSGCIWKSDGVTKITKIV